MYPEFPLEDRYFFQGLPVSIETKAGSTRSGTDPDGHEWVRDMHYDYGYIRGGALGADMEALDVYIGPNRKAEFAYIVKQHAIEKVKEWGGSECPNCSHHAHKCGCPQFYDEDKVMLGFSSHEEAKAAYLKQYDNPLFLGPIARMPMADFKAIVRSMRGRVVLNGPIMDSANHVFDGAYKDLLNTKKRPFVDHLKSFKISIKGLNDFKSIKREFFNNLPYKEAKAARLKSAERMLDNKNLPLDQLSNALQIAIEHGTKKDVSEARERLKKESEKHLKTAGQGMAKKLGLIGDDGQVLPEIMELTNSSEHYTDSAIYRMLLDKEKEVLKKMEASKAGSQEAIDLTDKLTAIYEEINQIRQDYAGKVSQDKEKAEKLAAHITDSLLNQHGISEKEAMAWAKKQRFTKAAKSRISSKYSMKSFYQDMADFYRMSGGRMPYMSITTTSARASASVEMYTYNLGSSIHRGVNFHEMTHLLENSPMIKAAAGAYLTRRALESGETEPRPLASILPASSYDSSEVAYKDNFYSPYMGKVYGDGYTEIFTMLTQELATPTRTIELLKKDPESFQFMLGLLSTTTNNDREHAAESVATQPIGEKYRKALLDAWNDNLASFDERKTKKFTIYTVMSLLGGEITVRVANPSSKLWWKSSVKGIGGVDAGFRDPDLAKLIAMEAIAFAVSPTDIDTLNPHTMASNLANPTYAHDEFSVRTEIDTSNVLSLA